MMEMIIFNDIIDVEGDCLVGYASQDCDLLLGIKVEVVNNE